MAEQIVTLGVPAARRAGLGSFLQAEGLGWRVVEEGAGVLNILEPGEAASPCTKETLYPGGRIDCSTALAMAEKYRVESGSIGRLMNLLGIRIRNCQLGCFG